MSYDILPHFMCETVELYALPKITIIIDTRPNRHHTDVM